MLYGELVPQGGGDPIPLLQPKLTIGRRENCDIRLQFSNVSSHHCELEFVNGYWRVRDLDSSNGTKINGERVDTAWVSPGDVISFAKHHYMMSYTPHAEAPPPLEEGMMPKMSLLEKAGLVKPERDAGRPANQVVRGGGARAQPAAGNGAGQPAANKPIDPPPKPAPPSDEDRVQEWLK